jgi:hypothetical protein
MMTTCLPSAVIGESSTSPSYILLERLR